jgi:hypothetical protein
MCKALRGLGAKVYKVLHIIEITLVSAESNPALSSNYPNTFAFTQPKTLPVHKMRFFAAILLGAASVSSAAAQLCPAANDLFYQAGSRDFYQIQCGIEYWTRTNLAASTIEDPIACAE